MLSVSSSIKFSLKAAAIAAFTVGCAHAVVVTYPGVQGPNPNPYSPPALEGTALVQSTAFFGKAERLGGQEFETSTPGNYGFDYTGGVADITAGPRGATQFLPAVAPQLKDNDKTGPYDPTTGRYNMTQLPAGSTVGHWVDAYSDFTLTFTGGVTALSFFVTDLGDFDGQVEVELYHGDQLLSTQQLMNGLSAPKLDGNGDPILDGSGNPVLSPNGNLLFFGATSDDGTDFTKVVFKISQRLNGAGTEVERDYIGFDSLWVGKYTGGSTGGSVPEPASLALVGLALAAGGFARRRAAR